MVQDEAAHPDRWSKGREAREGRKIDFRGGRERIVKNKESRLRKCKIIEHK